MRTEQLVHRDKPRDRDSVSPALQEVNPPSWHLTDSRGRPVHLSSAGYVLHFGRAYQLRVALPEDGTPLELHVVSRPAFVQTAQEQQVAAKHGRQYRCLPFTVRRTSNWHKFFHWPYEVLVGELDVECLGGDRAASSPVLLTCPVVARTPWTIGIVMLLVAGALVGWLAGQFEILARGGWAQGQWPPEGFWEWWRELQSNPRFWLWPLALAVANPLLALGSNVYHLWQRSRELERQYRDRWLASAPAQARLDGRP